MSTDPAAMTDSFYKTISRPRNFHMAMGGLLTGLCVQAACVGDPFVYAPASTAPPVASCDPSTQPDAATGVFFAPSGSDTNGVRGSWTPRRNRCPT